MSFLQSIRKPRLNQVLQKEHGSEACRLFKKLWHTEVSTNKATDEQKGSYRSYTCKMGLSFIIWDIRISNFRPALQLLSTQNQKFLLISLSVANKKTRTKKKITKTQTRMLITKMSRLMRRRKKRRLKKMMIMMAIMLMRKTMTMPNITMRILPILKIKLIMTQLMIMKMITKLLLQQPNSPYNSILSNNMIKNSSNSTKHLIKMNILKTRHQKKKRTI